MILVVWGLIACSGRTSPPAAAGLAPDGVEDTTAGGSEAPARGDTPAGNVAPSTAPATSAPTPSPDTPLPTGAAPVCTTSGTVDVNVTVKATAGGGGAAAPVPLPGSLTCQNIYDPDRSDYVPRSTGDFLSFLKGVNPGFLRWPTGYLSQRYSWTRDNGAATITDGWTFVMTPALLAAYMQLVRDSGSKPYITVNVDAPPASLADLVKFANVEQKYGIQWWEIGNEPDVDGYKTGVHTPEIYANKVVAIAAAMRAVDPTIKIVAGVMLSGENVRGVKPVDEAKGAFSWAKPILDIASKQMDGFAFHYYPMVSSPGPNYNCSSSACYCSTDAKNCTSTGYLLQEDADDWPPAGLDYADVIMRESREKDSSGAPRFPGLRQLLAAYKPGMWVWIDEFAEDPSYPASGAGISDRNIGMLWAADALGRFADHGTEVICKFIFKADAEHLYTLIDENLKPRPAYYTYWLYGQHYGDLAVKAQSDKITEVAAHASVRSQDGSLRLMLVNKNKSAQAVRITLSDFIPKAAASYQVIADSLYGTTVTLNGTKLSSANIGQGQAAIAAVRAEACGDGIVKLPPYSATLIIYAK